MSHIWKIQYAAALLLVLLASAPPAQAATPVSTKGGAVSSLCRLLLGFWEKAGSSLDPDGKLAAGLRSCAKADSGSSLDPSGRTATTDSGSSVDQSGLLRMTADAGSSLDPNGHP